MGKKYNLKPSRYNAGDVELITQQTLSRVGGKAISLAGNYVINNHGIKGGFIRLQDVIEGLLHALLGKATRGSEIAMDFAKNEEEITRIMASTGYGGGSTFGLYVSQVKGMLVHEHAGDEAVEDVALACVSLGLGLKFEAAYSGYWALILYQRLLSYYAYRYGAHFSLGMDKIEAIQHFNAGLVMTEIQETSEGSKTETPITSFSFKDIGEWFGEEPISHVNAQLMKDCELQAYKLNVEFQYSDISWKDVPYCEDKNVPQVNEFGKTTGYLNVGSIKYPCIDESHNIAPITGTALKRTIVESPPVHGAYSDESMDYIEKRLRANYPEGAQYSSDVDQAESYIDASGQYLVNWAEGNPPVVHHEISDSSIYEPYVYVNDHETRDGNPWTNEYRYGACYDYQDNYIIGGAVGAYREYYCYEGANQCIGATFPTTVEECEALGCSWRRPLNEIVDRCVCINLQVCGNAGGSWFPNVWKWTSLYEVPAPYGFPAGYVDDMSLRHQITDYDQSDWWNDVSYIHRTGFAVVPLEFSSERLITFYSDYKANPTIRVDNIARRAFSWTVPTIHTESGTVGPPQPLGYTATSADYTDYEGGPFAHVSFYSDNKTQGQLSKITMVPGWMWRFRLTVDTPPFHTFETGGWNMPLTARYSAPGHAEPIDGELTIDIESKSISNNYESVYLTGNQIHPSIYTDSCDVTDEQCFANNEEGRHTQILTRNRFFGMGDGSQDYEIVSANRFNAGYGYVYHSTPTTGLSQARLDEPLLSWEGKQMGSTLGEVLHESGLEGLYSVTTMGLVGESYWNEYITGYIFTGWEPSDPRIGNVVSCMHPYVAFSTSSDKTLNYWYIEPNPPEYFPFSGYDSMDPMGQYRSLAPVPFISQCVYLFPEILDPTTTTTEDPQTTTTCDPMYDPNCQSTTTSTTEDPTMAFCDDPILIDCPIDCAGGPPGNQVTVEACNYEQCVYATSMEEHCVTGFYPEDWGWKPLYGKQRGENPPRYWRGPYASTHHKFMYPNASGAIEQYYSEQIKDDLHEEIGGFPHKIKFKVEVEEYTVKNLCSGGFIDSATGVILSSNVKNEEGQNQPQISKTSGDHLWPDLVDSGFTPQSIGAYTHSSNGDCITVINDSSGLVGFPIRNHTFYDQVVSFCDGNRVGQANRLLNVESEGDQDSYMTGLGFGGFHRFTGYGFEVIATYAKPSYSLLKYGLNFGSIRDALSVGNETVYKCGFFQEGANLPLDDFDPIYFQPMISDTSFTGSIIKGGVYGKDQSWDEGQLIHPHKIYGDHWMGLRSGSLLYVPTGICDSRYTTMPPEPCEGLIDYSEYALEAFCDCVATDYLSLPGSRGEVKFSNIANESPQYGFPDDIFNGTYLFNISPEGIDIHFRNTPYFDGYEFEDPTAAECSNQGGGSEGEVEMPEGDQRTCPLITKGHSYSITGMGPSGATKIELFKNDGSLSGLELNVTAQHTVGEGVLFELPTGEWNQFGNGDFETILEHGARVAQGLGASQTTTTMDPSMGFTTTTAPPSEEGGFIDPSFVRASGWKEFSVIKLRLFDFEISQDDLKTYPNETQFIFEQNGSCTMSGDMKYDRQEEASIFSEGIVLKDTSDDPMFKDIDYPHYASDVVKRPGIDLPYEETTLYEAGHNVVSAPSRMLSRWEIDYIKGISISGGYMIPIKTKGPHNYNKFIWPTISDVYHYNGSDMSWESLPPDDGHIYPNSYLMICGENGQPIDIDENAYPVRKQYTVTQHWTFYDSMVVDPMVNTKWKRELTKDQGGAIGETVEPAGGYMISQGTSAWEIINNFVKDPFGRDSLTEDGTSPYTEGE